MAAAAPGAAAAAEAPSVAAEDRAKAAAEAQQRIKDEMMAPGAEFEVGPVTVKHGFTYPKAFLRCWTTMAEYYREKFSEFADQEFVVFEGERYTYRQVDAESQAFAWSLANKFGIGPGDRVGISMRNFPEWCFAFIAITRIGAVAVPFNSLYKADEYPYVLKDSGCKVVVCDGERYSIVKGACASLGVEIIVARPQGQLPSGTVAYTACVQEGKGKACADALNLDTDDATTIMYTSGTTGHPKGVVLTHRGVLQQMVMSKAVDLLVQRVGLALGQPALKWQPCMILPVPLFHVTGLHHVFLACFVTGRKLVLMYKWDALHALQLIDKEKPNSWTGVPTQVQDMMEHPDFDKYDMSSLRMVGGGGGPTPKSQVAKTHEKYKAPPLNGYGLTETNGAVTTNTGDEYLKRPRSVGKGYPVTDFEIRDVDTRKKLPANEQGEIWIKSVLNMKGYHNLPEKTAEVVDGEGWFASGDVGVMDEEGFVFIQDRAKDIIIRGGENIGCAEVETAFYETGKVMECAVFGIPDYRLGEVVGLMVVPRNGCEGVSPKELRDAVVGKIAFFKIPDEANIFVTKERLPRGATEKIQKREIRDKVVAMRKGSPPQSKL